jgi:hypothetical protein
MDADAKLDAVVRRTIAALPLDLDRATKRVYYARELDEKPVAGRLDQPAAMRSDLRIDHLGPDRLETIQRPFFVSANKARIANDIGRQDRRQPTFRAIASLCVHCF